MPTRRQIQELIAELAPRPEVPALIRKLPEAGVETGPLWKLGT